MTPDELAEYRAMRPRYRELSALVAEYVKTSDEPDDVIAEAVGWNVETIKRNRAPKPEHVEREPVVDLAVLAVLTKQWQETNVVVRALMQEAEVNEKQAYRRLRQAREREQIDVLYSEKTSRYMGQRIHRATHYKLKA